jgi:ABC-type sugar transport system ATPase subunit
MDPNGCERRVREMAGSNGDAVVSCRNINKFFGGVHALRNINLELRAGEVLALVGDNGAGKTTLTRVISATERMDSGELWYGETRVKRPTPAAAHRYGIETVPQHLALCDNLSASMNVVLANPPLRWRIGSFGVVDRQAARATATEQVRRVGVELTDYDAPIRRMSGGQRQAIAIARALVRGRKVIMFDEPTAALGVRQREATLALIRSVAEYGVAALVISHNVDDVFSVADRVVAFRLGRIVLDKPIGETSKEEVVLEMEGLAHARV